MKKKRLSFTGMPNFFNLDLIKDKKILKDFDRNKEDVQ